MRAFRRWLCCLLLLTSLGVFCHGCHAQDEDVRLPDEYRPVALLIMVAAGIVAAGARDGAFRGRSNVRVVRTVPLAQGREVMLAAADGTNLQGGSSPWR